MYVRICGRGIQCTEQCTERCIYTREIIAIGGALVSSRYIDLASLPNTEDFLLRRAAATANPVPRRRSSSVAAFRPRAIAPHDPPCCCVNVTVTRLLVYSLSLCDIVIVIVVAGESREGSRKGQGETVERWKRGCVWVAMKISRNACLLLGHGGERQRLSVAEDKETITAQTLGRSSM